MAFTTLLNTIWSSRLNANLRKNYVFAHLMSRNYEVDAQGAVAVNVNKIGSISISDYAGGSTTMSLEDISSTSQSFDINQRKYFNFKVEDYAQAASNITMVDGAMAEAADGLSDTIDQFISAKYSSISSSATSNFTTGYLVSSGSGGAPSSGSAYQLVTAVAEELSKRNVPARKRFMVVSPWFTKLLNDDGKWLGGNYQAGDNGLVQGAVISGIQLYESNNLSKTSYGVAEKFIAGHPGSWEFASQINKMERYRPEKFFADAVKGLFVYGALVTKPSGLVYINVTKQS